MLRYGSAYTDVGQEAYELKFQTRRLAGLKEAARSLGYQLVRNENVPVSE